MVFFKFERTAFNVLPEHVQKCLLAHYQLVMTDVSELQVWLLVDRVLRKERNIKASRFSSDLSKKKLLENITGDRSLHLSLYIFNVRQLCICSTNDKKYFSFC